MAEEEGKHSITTTNNTTARPTDDDILNFENQIREEQVNTQPLISAKLPIGILQGEYLNSSNPNFIPKVIEMDEQFSCMRKSRGDGNCFFRSFGFGLIEQAQRLAPEERTIWISSLQNTIDSLLEAAKFDKLAYEDFYDELFTTLRFDLGDADCLAALWDAEPHRSHSIVVLLRLVASAYLRAHAAAYEPFIWEAGLDMVHYCQQFVECMGVESDQIHAIAVGRALGVDIEIAYLDGSEGPLCRIQFGASEDGDAGPTLVKVIMLYRPGHYDLLYPK